MKCDVLIIGAGPTGLTLALWLARAGVHVRIVDKSSLPGQTSRAMAVHARTLEFYRQLGIAEEAVAGGIIMDRMCVRREGRQIANVVLKDIGRGLSPYPFVLSYPQDDHEKLLVKHLAAAGVTVDRDTELTGFASSDGSVQATLMRGGETETAYATYLCGCDGAKSTVRQTLGEKFSGGTYRQVFYVADAMAEGAGMDRSVNVCVSRQDFCLALPVRSSGSMRLIGIVPPEQERKENITWEDVAASAERNTALTVKKINWFSTYHVHHRVAEAFRSGHVFLLGDAAHIHSPAGGQGMNTGIGDAMNLAWKLAMVVQGKANESLLDTYAAERMPFARWLVDYTDRLFAVMASRSWYGRFGRAVVIPLLMPLALRLRVMQFFMFRTVSQIRIRYPRSALSSGAAGGVKGGDRLPWVKENTVEGTDNFASLALRDWQAHVYGRATGNLREACTRMGLQLCEFAWSGAAAKAGLSRDALYLVRPDGYVALADATQDSTALAQFMPAAGLHVFVSK